MYDFVSQEQYKEKRYLNSPFENNVERKLFYL